MTQSATTDWASRLGKGVGSYWGGQTTGASPKVLSLVDDSPATAQVSFSSLGDILNYGGATDYRGPRQHASFTDPVMQTFGAVTGQEWTPQDSLRYGAPAPARRRRSILGSSVGQRVFRGVRHLGKKSPPQRVHLPLAMPLTFCKTGTCWPLSRRLVHPTWLMPLRTHREYSHQYRIGFRLIRPPLETVRALAISSTSSS